MEITEQSLIPRLMEEFAYSYQGAQLLVVKLRHSVPTIQAAFAMWWNNALLPDLEVEGYTVEQLMQRHGMNPIAALLTLDWLIREPDKARASLRRGHDAVRHSA